MKIGVDKQLNICLNVITEQLKGCLIVIGKKYHLYIFEGRFYYEEDL